MQSQYLLENSNLILMISMGHFASQHGWNLDQKFSALIARVDFLTARVGVFHGRVEIFNAGVEILIARVEILNALVEILTARVGARRGSAHTERARSPRPGPSRALRPPPAYRHAPRP